MTLSAKWGSLAVAVALGFATVAPVANAADAYDRVAVGASDVMLRGGVPYYRHGDRGRLQVEHGRHGRPTYYRTVYRDAYAQYSYDDAYGGGNHDRAYARSHRRAELAHERQHQRKHARQHRRDEGHYDRGY